MKETLTYWQGSSLYINPSSRCTNRCLFCVKNFAEGVYGFDLRLKKDPEPQQLADAVQKTWNDGFEEAAVVGFGEPLLNLEGTLRAVREIKRRADVPVRINSNGHALRIYPGRDVPRELLDAGVERIQVSLNAQDEETYEILCRPQLKEAVYDSILEFSERCAQIMELDISAIELPGVDLDRIARFARRIGARFRVRGYHGAYSVEERIRRLLLDRDSM